MADVIHWQLDRQKTVEKQMCELNRPIPLVFELMLKKGQEKFNLNKTVMKNNNLWK